MCIRISMSSAFQIFECHYQSIKKLIRSADLYAIHALAAIKNEPVNIKQIEKIIKNENSHSLMVNSWEWVMSESEKELLKQDHHISGLCEQIVQTTYISIENYLVNRFEELLNTKVENKCVCEGIIKNLSFTSLKRIKKYYADILDIRIAEFEPDITNRPNEWFDPNTSWEGIIMLSEARNEIAHEGHSEKYNIRYLADAYAPWYFAWRWVGLFGSKFT